MKFENWTIDELLERCIDIDDGSVFMNSDEVAALRRKVAELRSAQPVSQGKLPEGFKLMPLEITDAIAEAIAMEARCCGGIALCIYEAALAAAPEGGNG